MSRDSLAFQVVNIFIKDAKNDEEKNSFRAAAYCWKNAARLLQRHGDKDSKEVREYYVSALKNYLYFLETVEEEKEKIFFHYLQLAREVLCQVDNYATELLVSFLEKNKDVKEVKKLCRESENYADKKTHDYLWLLTAIFYKKAALYTKTAFCFNKVYEQTEFLYCYEKTALYHEKDKDFRIAGILWEKLYKKFHKSSYLTFAAKAYEQANMFQEAGFFWEAAFSVTKQEAYFQNAFNAFMKTTELKKKANLILVLAKKTTQMDQAKKCYDVVAGLYKELGDTKNVAFIQKKLAQLTKTPEDWEKALNSFKKLPNFDRQVYLCEMELNALENKTTSKRTLSPGAFLIERNKRQKPLRMMMLSMFPLPHHLWHIIQIVNRRNMESIYACCL